MSDRLLTDACAPVATANQVLSSLGFFFPFFFDCSCHDAAIYLGNMLKVINWNVSKTLLC